MDFDVLIIGSGAGGGTAALALCEQGFKVGLLERGPRFDPKKDFVQNYPDWETRTDPLNHARDDEQTIDPNYRVTYIQGERERRRSSLVYHRVHGVGGSTLHYQGEAHRFAEHCFSQQSDSGWGLDWPINYADLEPFYAKAESLLGVAGHSEGEFSNPFKPQRGAYPTPGHGLSPRSQLLADAAKQVGMSVLPNPLALPSVSFDGRTPCQHSGGCNFGCVFGAKSSVDQAIIPVAEKTGNLTLLTQARATKLNLDEAGQIQSVSCLVDGEATSFTAEKYLLAMGAIETPRLMLHSNFANQYDQVGRYFMETVIARLNINVELDFQTHRGPPLDSRIWDFCKPDDNQTSGFVLGSAGYLYSGIGPARHPLRVDGLGRQHKQTARNSFGKSVRLFAITEQEPQASNRVTLSDALDDVGVPKLKVHCDYSQRDLHTLEVMMEKLNIWQSAIPNSRRTSTSTSHSRSSATHVAGTCRMGEDPNYSVVDAYGKVHGSDNCYIADGSVMPTQGAGDSPSLTIQALALRTAEKISADLKS